jgi:hypothetical protein
VGPDPAPKTTLALIPAATCFHRGDRLSPAHDCFSTLPRAAREACLSSARPRLVPSEKHVPVRWASVAEHRECMTVPVLEKQLITDLVAELVVGRDSC